MSDNPLLSMRGLPPFSQIKPEHVVPAIDQVLEESRQQVAALLENKSEYSWENLVQPLEIINERIGRVWSPVGHMSNVVNSDALREAYNACLPKLSAYSTEMGQNENLFNAFKAIQASDEYAQLSAGQKKIIDNSVRDFKLSGVELNKEKQQRFKEIMQQLSNLNSKFDQNLMDATQAWHKHIDDESLLAGLPDGVKSLAQQNALQKKKEGWVFTLDFPCYYPVMLYADNQQLREELYTAYITRASDQGPNANEYDNSAYMEEIVALRHESAELLGFNNYAEQSLARSIRC